MTETEFRALVTSKVVIFVLHLVTQSDTDLIPAVLFNDENINSPINTKMATVSITVLRCCVYKMIHPYEDSIIK